jgi:hypothetical protein
LLQSSINQQHSQDIMQFGLYKVALKDLALTRADWMITSLSNKISSLNYLIGWHTRENYLIGWSHL